MAFLLLHNYTDFIETKQLFVKIIDIINNKYFLKGEI